MNLVAELKKEHAEILDILNAFKKGRGFDSQEWRDNLFRAKKKFLDHLAREDSELYPLIEKNGGENGRIFAEEMKQISDEVIRFLDKYRETHDGPGFSRDYAGLMNVLEKRIRAEEEILYLLV